MPGGVQSEGSLTLPSLLCLRRGGSVLGFLPRMIQTVACDLGLLMWLFFNSDRDKDAIWSFGTLWFQDAGTGFGGWVLGHWRPRARKFLSLCRAGWFTLIQSLGFSAQSALLSSYMIKNCFFWKDKGILRTHLFFFFPSPKTGLYLKYQKKIVLLEHLNSLNWIFNFISGQVNLKSLFFHVEFSALDIDLLPVAGRKGCCDVSRKLPGRGILMG